MARTITWDELRDLAGFEAEKGCAISLYLDLDPKVTPTPGDAVTRLHSLLDEAAKGDGANRRDMTHDQRVGLRADFERIRSYYESEFERDGAHGLAIFSSGLDNIWRTLPLTEAVRDEVNVGRTLYLAPLVPLVGRGEGALVVVVGRERGHFYRLRGGRLQDLADHTEEQPGRHDQGGWSQSRYQRHIETRVREHLQEVSDALDRLVRRLHNIQVVVISSEESPRRLRGASLTRRFCRGRRLDVRRGPCESGGAAPARRPRARPLPGRERDRGRGSLGGRSGARRPGRC